MKWYFWSGPCETTRYMLMGHHVLHACVCLNSSDCHDVELDVVRKSIFPGQQKRVSDHKFY